jgi:integrase
MQVATAHGLIPSNPVRAVRKVGGERDEVRPQSPIELERLLCALQGRDRILALLAGHLGLRPGEARIVPWGAFGGERLVIDRDVAKRNARRACGVDVPRATAAELREWRLVSGRPGDREPIVGSMSANAVRLRTRKRLRPVAAQVTGREDVTLYTLRHTHASLCHYAGIALPAAAARLGHSIAIHVATYAHVIEGCTDAATAISTR